LRNCCPFASQPTANPWAAFFIPLYGIAFSEAAGFYSVFHVCHLSTSQITRNHKATTQQPQDNQLAE
jgi:hypothetical protein